jgi:hypothetical protein
VMRTDNTASIWVHFNSDASVASEAAKMLDVMLIGEQICSVVYEGSRPEATLKVQILSLLETNASLKTKLMLIV